MCRSMTLSGELISFTRAIDDATFVSTRLAAAMVICAHALKINRRLAWLAYRRQRIACARLFFDPLLFVADDVEQELFIFSARKIFFAVLLVGAVVQWLARFAVKLLRCPFSDAAVEVNVGRVELFLAWLEESVQPFD